jgi:hypothetical protein
VREQSVDVADSILVKQTAEKISENINQIIIKSFSCFVIALSLNQIGDEISS